MTADEMFEALGYRKREFENSISYSKNCEHIDFSLENKLVNCGDELWDNKLISMQELNAINKKCEERGWIK